MKNITISIDDETYQKAQALAAQRGTSISAMVRDYLRQCAAEDKEWRENVEQRNRMMQEMLKKTNHFGVGEKPTREEMHERGPVR